MIKFNRLHCLLCGVVCGAPTEPQIGAFVAQHNDGGVASAFMGNYHDADALVQGMVKKVKKEETLINKSELKNVTRGQDRVVFVNNKYVHDDARLQEVLKQIDAEALVKRLDPEAPVELILQGPTPEFTEEALASLRVLDDQRRTILQRIFEDFWKTSNVSKSNPQNQIVTPSLFNNNVDVLIATRILGPVIAELKDQNGDCLLKNKKSKGSNLLHTVVCQQPDALTYAMAEILGPLYLRFGLLPDTFKHGDHEPRNIMDIILVKYRSDHHTPDPTWLKFFGRLVDKHLRASESSAKEKHSLSKWRSCTNEFLDLARDRLYYIGQMKTPATFCWQAFDKFCVKIAQFCPICGRLKKCLAPFFTTQVHKRTAKKLLSISQPVDSQGGAA